MKQNVVIRTVSAVWNAAVTFFGSIRKSHRRFWEQYYMHFVDDCFTMYPTHPNEWSYMTSVYYPYGNMIIFYR